MSALKTSSVRWIAAAAVVAAMLPTGAAHADSFVFGYRSGSWNHGYRGHHGHYRHHHNFGRRHYYPYYAQSVVVVPPPRVVYQAPAPVYVPAPAHVPPVTLVPASPIYQTTDGRYCREYQTVITVDGAARDSYGTACYAPDGTWRIVN